MRVYNSQAFARPSLWSIQQAGALPRVYHSSWNLPNKAMQALLARKPGDAYSNQGEVCAQPH
jgi:hypothetical protein